MVSAISFTGTYKVNFNNNNPDNFLKFQEYALDKEMREGVKTILKDRIVKNGDGENFNYEAERTLIVPDNMDIDVETFCANNGISFQKLETNDLLNPKNVVDRIQEPPKGFTKVDIDVEKLEDLIETQNSNLEHCESDYEKYYYDSLDTMLRSGDKIPASTLYINPNNGYIGFRKEGNEILKRYVNMFGVRGLNDKQVGLFFTQRTKNPDHCVYFALKDMGLKKVPIYVNEQSYEAGKILKLF